MTRWFKTMLPRSYQHIIILSNFDLFIIHYIIGRWTVIPMKNQNKNTLRMSNRFLLNSNILFAFSTFSLWFIVLFQYYLARKILWEVHLGNIQIKLLEINHGKKWCVPLKWKLHHINNRISICLLFLFCILISFLFVICFFNHRTNQFTGQQRTLVGFRSVWVLFWFHFICFVLFCDAIFPFKQTDFFLLLLFRLFYLLLFDQKQLCCNPHWKMFKCENVNRLNWINIIHVKKFDEVEWWDLKMLVNRLILQFS